ncbi:hypothetical protein M8C21_005043 [Ambrosia artemisiifolia]|uniref:Uncharacterized protein n=1 Tax=Ambrosia artemisiifolia TaxID=4212 RepID=A0AAD5GDD4_AMBAR|nr:hypothetical protein M8C21_005043 [Ambrosia artemisiifolia]
MISILCIVKTNGTMEVFFQSKAVWAMIMLIFVEVGVIIVVCLGFLLISARHLA